MNYRHIYHAGNFADVFKHLIIARIIEYLKKKDHAFRVIDTHAGTGIYDLSSDEAQKTGEWIDGIGRILSKPIDRQIEPLVNPWLDVVFALNGSKEKLTRYPGSPVLIRKLLRKQDRLTAIELHEADYKKLAVNFTGDYQARIIHLDGYLALGAHVPPKEKRGLILVDPPFEKTDEFERLVEGLIKAYKRFPGGIYALWYPVKHYNELNWFMNELKGTGIAKILRLELRIKQRSQTPGLDGCGMIIVNPPYVLPKEMKQLKAFLLDRLAQEDHAQIIEEWINGEAV
ncbi:23S rRNA (adenine(2030)-N(6))-methyltransferase RlmJ [uncultured Bartonella sp.]|uniref:23S rRNA (adenine(2030)-N(6))-methyltransferase RlmJ n=1 Tax=uncultured Bartonella sp. TaxID=104108 RepID=UPI002614AC18|nr:23S rRNA (adenine(2030)-N(6))-methyltransferase RlmJ [uncultured Bartonella sp.]